MRDKNPEVMSIELYVPIFLYHTIEIDNLKLDKLYRKHVENFMENYMEV